MRFEKVVERSMFVNIVSAYTDTGEKDTLIIIILRNNSILLFN